MSVRVMSLVFEANITDISMQEKKRRVTAPTLKLVLLALADHCNDEGEGAYPSQHRILRKTSLERSSITYALSALKQEGLILKAGVSKRDTINYTLNLPQLKSLVHLVDTLQPSLPPGGQPLVHQVDTPCPPDGHEPSFNHPLIIIEGETEKQKLLKDLEGAALSIFGNNFTSWRKLARDLEKDAVQIHREDGQLVISGVGLQAATFQDRYARSFSNVLAGIYNHPTEVLFEELTP